MQAPTGAALGMARRTAVSVLLACTPLGLARPACQPANPVLRGRSRLQGPALVQGVWLERTGQAWDLPALASVQPAGLERIRLDWDTQAQGHALPASLENTRLGWA